MKHKNTALPLHTLCRNNRLSTGSAFAQGCVAAHCQPARDRSAHHIRYARRSGRLLHPQPHHRHWLSRLQLEQVLHRRRPEIARANAIRNHQNIFNIGLEYRLSPRWSLIADVPVYDGTRNQLYPPSGIFQVSGLGDVTIGAQSWIIRPPSENGGNIAVSASLKIPSGIDGATGSALYKGQIIKATADQSLQPGDGGWGFVLGSQAYKSLWHQAPTSTPRDFTSSIPRTPTASPAFRSQPGQSVFSVTDQYLFRTGVSQSCAQGARSRVQPRCSRRRRPRA